MVNRKLLLMALLVITVMIVAACGTGTPDGDTGTGTTGSAEMTPGAGEDLGLGDTDTTTGTTGTDSGLGAGATMTDTTGTMPTAQATATTGAGSDVGTGTATPEAEATSTGSDTGTTTPESGAGSATGTDTGSGVATGGWQNGRFMDAFGFLATEGFQLDSARGDAESQVLTGTYDEKCEFVITFDRATKDEFDSLDSWVEADLGEFDANADVNDVRYFEFEGAISGTGGNEQGNSGSGSGQGNSGSGNSGQGNSGAGMGNSQARGQYDIAVWMSGDESASPSARIYLWTANPAGNNERGRVATITLGENAEDCDAGDLETFVDYLMEQAGYTETERAIDS